MKTRIRLLFFGVLAVITAFSQQSQYIVTNLEWVNNLAERDSRESVPSAVDQNGNIYSIGFVTQSGNRNAVLQKIDSVGSTVWVQYYDGTNSGDDKAYAIYLDTSGYVYICGESAGNGTGKDFLTIKYDVSGNLIWSSEYDGAGYDDVAISIVVDSAGNVYTGGRSKNTSGNFDYYVVQYDQYGSYLWDFRYDGTANGDDRLRSMAIYNSTYLYVTGYTSSTGVGKDITTIQVDCSNGSKIWTKTINGSANGNDEGQMVIMDGSDPVIVGGIVNSGSNTNYYIAKLDDTTSNVSWSSTYDAFGYADMAYSIAKNDSGQFGITGLALNTNYEYHTVIYDNSGHQIAVDEYQTDISVPTVAPKIACDTIVGYFYVVGETENNTVTTDVVVYQLSTTANREWTYTFDGSGNGVDNGVDVAVNSYGQLFVVAQTENLSGYADITTFRLSQTPIYFPPDTLSEPTPDAYLFYENKGQILDYDDSLVPQVKYYTEHVYPTHFFDADKISFKFFTAHNDTSIQDTIQRIDLEFYENSPYAQLYPIDHAQGYVNYLLSYLPENVTDVRGFRKLISPNIYPGIDLHISSNSDGLKLYYVIRPGYDPERVVLQFSGADTTYIYNNELVVSAFNSDLIFKQPTVYQIDSSGWVVPLSTASWAATGGRYGISLPSYNSALPLVIAIDRGHSIPASNSSIANLDWSTFYGGSLHEIFRAVKVGPNGLVYALGASQAYSQTYFPNNGPLTITTNPTASTLAEDMVLCVFDSFGVRKAVNIYGQIGDDQPLGLTILSDNSVVIVGNTPTTGGLMPPATQPAGAYAINTASGRPGFLVKFGPMTSGNPPLIKDIKWTTRFNGYVSDIDSKPNDDIYVTTIFNSATTADTMYKSGAYNNDTIPTGWHDQIWKFGSTGVRKWSTIFPNGSISSGFTAGQMPFWGLNMNLAWIDNVRRCKIDCDSNGFVIAGDAQNKTLLTYSKYGAMIDSTFDTTNTYTLDGFLARFNDNDSLVFSTYIGGSGSEVLQDVKINALNQIFVVGSTSSKEDSIMTYWPGIGYIDSTLTNQGRTKIYIAQYDTSGNRLWATYYGDNTTFHSAAWALEFDDLNNLYVTGQARDFRFDVYNAGGTFDQTTNQGTGSGAYESFMLCFGSINELKWNTFFGGNYEEIGLDLAFNNSGNSLVKVGATYSWGTGQTANPFPLVNYPGAWFASKINAGASGYSANFSYEDCFISRFTTSPFVGIKEYFSNEEDVQPFVIFPNPSSSEIFIAFKDKIKNKSVIQIHNSLGQVIYEKSFEEITDHFILQVPIFTLSNGVYVVSVQSGQNRNALKFIKNN